MLLRMNYAWCLERSEIASVLRDVAPWHGRPTSQMVIKGHFISEVRSWDWTMDNYGLIQFSFQFCRTFGTFETGGHHQKRWPSKAMRRLPKAETSMSASVGPVGGCLWLGLKVVFHKINHKGWRSHVCPKKSQNERFPLSIRKCIAYA